jgi:hypothetical protein
MLEGGPEDNFPSGNWSGIVHEANFVPPLSYVVTVASDAAPSSSEKLESDARSHLTRCISLSPLGEVIRTVATDFGVVRRTARCESFCQMAIRPPEGSCATGIPTEPSSRASITTRLPSRRKVKSIPPSRVVHSRRETFPLDLLVVQPDETGTHVATSTRIVNVRRLAVRAVKFNQSFPILSAECAIQCDPLLNDVPHRQKHRWRRLRGAFVSEDSKL